MPERADLAKVAVIGLVKDGAVETAFLTEADSQRAEAFWADYQTSHDVSGRIGSAAGIDPETGAIWFGESIVDICKQLRAQGVTRPLHFVRVGSATYYRKGARR